MPNPISSSSSRSSIVPDHTEITAPNASSVAKEESHPGGEWAKGPPMERAKTSAAPVLRMTPTETGAEGASGGYKPWTPPAKDSPTAAKICETSIETGVVAAAAMLGEKLLGKPVGMVLASVICAPTPQPNATPREENAAGAGGASGH